jgi:hypothetical protein
MKHGARVLRVVVALLISVVARAQAQADSPALSWLRDDGAELCISVQELASRVEQRLGKPVFVGASSATLHIEGRIARRPGGGFRVHLTASDAGGKVLGHRTLDASSADCRALDESLVLVIALAVDSSGGFVALPEGLSEAGDPAASLLADLQSAPPVQAAAPAVPAPPTPAPPAPAKALARDPRDRLQLRLGVLALGELGLVPDVGIGLGLEPQLIVPGDWLISLRGSGVLANTESIEGGGQVAIGALLAALGACTPQASFSWGGLRGCAGARAGILSIEATDLEQPRSPRRLLLDPWLAGEISWPIGGGVRLRVHAEAHLPFIRDTIQVLDEARRPVRAYEIAALSFGLGVGLLIPIVP